MIRLVRGTVHLLALVIAVVSITLLLLVGIGPRTGRFQVITVLTGSMTPVAPRGSMAVIEPKPRTALAVGDVLSYAIPVEDHHVVTHRVVELHQQDGATVIRTKGDANDAADPWVAVLNEPTVWTERMAVPHLGRAITMLRSPLVNRFGQLAPLLIAALFLRNLWRRPEDAPDALPA